VSTVKRPNVRIINWASEFGRLICGVNPYTVYSGLVTLSPDYLTFRSDVPTIVLTGYSISIPTQFVLLTVVPLRHRVLFGNMVRVLWTCYLTHASNTGTQRRIFGSRKREELKDWHCYYHEVILYFDFVSQLFSILFHSFINIIHLVMVLYRLRKTTFFVILYDPFCYHWSLLPYHLSLFLCYSTLLLCNSTVRSSYSPLLL
jgi:hypothetical protein